MSVPPARPRHPQLARRRPSSTRDPRRRPLGASSSTCRPGRATTPGSHLDVRLTAPDGYQATRSYSIASAGEGTRVVLAVDELPDGEVSPFLVHDLRAGDQLELHGPLGAFFVWTPAGSRRDAPAGAAHRGRLGRRAAVRDGRRARGGRRCDGVPAAVLGAHAGRRVLPRGARRARRGDAGAAARLRLHAPRAGRAGRRAPGRITRDLLDAATLPAASAPLRVRVRPHPVRRGGGRMADRRRASSPAMCAPNDSEVRDDEAGWKRAGRAPRRRARLGRDGRRRALHALRHARSDRRSRWSTRRAMGTVARCAHCDSVLATFVEGDDGRVWFGMPGISGPGNDALTCPTCLSSPSRISRPCSLRPGVVRQRRRRRARHDRGRGRPQA